MIVAKRTFPVEYAILGLLSQGPLHGYALRKRVDSALSSFWTIATSQIYSALHSMQNDDLVSAEVQPQEGRPPRNVYLITERGRKEFDRWCASPVRHLRDMRVEFLAKLYFVRLLGDRSATSLIDDQMIFLKRLRSRVSHRKNLKTDDPMLAALASRFRDHQISAAIDWLAECREHLAG
ncbi:MAG TPA: PadR family transcriptional regulator [Candidatus Acetothermia bacterium]|nr:PadR family transcriptional regulator [Candidatus Acetothermia bacterium]